MMMKLIALTYVDASVDSQILSMIAFSHIHVFGADTDGFFIVIAFVLKTSAFSKWSLGWLIRSKLSLVNSMTKVEYLS